MAVASGVSSLRAADRAEQRRERRTRASAPAPREAPEQVVVRIRRSGRRLVLPVLCFVAVCYGTGYWWGRLPGWLGAALPIAAAVLVVLLSAVPLVLWLNRVTIVTTRRVIVTHGFLVRHRDELPLGRGTEARLKRGPLQLLTNSGDVVVTGADRSIRLRDVSRARLVQRAVTDLIDRAARG